MTSAQAKPRRSAPPLLALLASLALVFTLMPTGPASAEDPNELVVNGTFSGTGTHWRTNDAANHVLAITHTGRWNTRAAEITTNNTSPVVLNDVRNTVSSTPAGSLYTMSAYVRSSRAGVTAQVRAREESAAGTKAHEVRFVVPDTKWHKVTLRFTTEKPDSALDLNVQFWGTKSGQKLYVDDVSLLRTGQSAVPPVAPSRPGQCTRPAPKGNEFGSSISTSGQTTAQAIANTDALFGKIPVVRIWDPGMVVDWQNARTKVLDGRTLVMSFRPSPAEVLSGKHDEAFRKWFAEAPANSTIYWNYMHEPEQPIDVDKTVTVDQYRKAWRHLDAIADSVCRPNMYATLVLMGWTARPESKKDWRTYYPGDDVIDVMAWDPYNGAANPGREGIYASPETIFDHVRTASAEAGKPYAIAETGTLLLPGDSGSARASWLRAITAYHQKHGALWVTYFNSTNGGEYRLLDVPSRDAWRQAVASSRRG